MTEPRFTVRFYCPHPGWLRGGYQPGYAVYDRGKRITRTWLDFGEALQHRDKIAEYYARWGFV